MLGAASSTATEGDVASPNAVTRRRRSSSAKPRSTFPTVTLATEGLPASEAGALSRQGDERGENAALQSSIEVYGRVLAEYPRSQAALDWAATQNELGVALWSARRAGERDGAAQ